MQKFILLILLYFLATNAYSQIEKIIHIENQGTLANVLTAEELSTVTKLTLTGNIDARDFKTMRDEMPLLEEIELSGAIVAAYSGSNGTGESWQTEYAENEIPDKAFSYLGGGNNTILKSVILPLSCNTIGYWAFGNCRNITSLTIPHSVTLIRNYAFKDCSKIKTFIIPSGITKIDFGVFQGCTSLDSIFLPTSLTEISGYAFAYCISLKSITIPESVIIIGANAFERCDSLSSFSFPSKITTIEYRTFYNCKGLTTVNLPSGLKHLRSWAFSGCSKLDSINLPNKVISIEGRVFSDCIGLRSIRVNSTIPINLSNSTYVFFNVNEMLCRLFVPYGSIDNYSVANEWQDFQHIVELPEIQDTLLVLNQTISDVEAICFNATQTITVAGDGNPVAVLSNASATFIAGQSIRFLPGFHAQNGSYVSAYITTDGSFCDMLPQSIMQNTPEPDVFEKSVTLENKGEQVLEQMLKAYPNPSSGLFTIEMENFGDQKQVEIINITGQTVYKQLTNENKINIDISTLNKGLYIIYCNDRFTTKTQRVVLN